MKHQLIGAAAVASLSVLPAFAGLDDGLTAWFDFETLRPDGRVVNRADENSPLNLVLGTSITNVSHSGDAAMGCDGAENARANFSYAAAKNVTYSMWVRRDRDVGIYEGSSYPHLFSNFPGGVRVALGKTSLGASVYVNEDVVFDGAPVLFRKAWQHLCFTFEDVSAAGDGSKVAFRLYINGVLQQSVDKELPEGKKLGSVAGTANLGGNGGNRPFTGILDEVRLWNRALSAAEVREEFERVPGGPEDALLSRWTMDEVVTESGVRKFKDSGVQARDLELGSGVTTVAGVKGNAARTDGTTASWAYTTAAVNISDMTLCAWVNQSVDSSKDNESKIGGPNNGPRFFKSNGAHLIYEINPTASSATLQWIGSDGGRSISPFMTAQGTWCHVALTTHYADGKACQKYYVNGIKTWEATFDVTTSVWCQKDGELLFFNMAKNSNRPYEGLADDLRLYNRALSDKEIAEIFRGPAAVSAGADFSVAGGVATLHGWVAPNGTDTFREGYAGAVAWSLVSAPAGGETAEIAVKSSPVTHVSLPVSGDYTFRLSVTADGESLSSDVTVTRLAESPTGEKPTLALATAASVNLPLRLRIEAEADNAARVFWSKVSGPGGVWFEPDCEAATFVTFGAAGEYTLRCTAENAVGATVREVAVTANASEGTVDLADGLKIHWPMDNDTLHAEKVSGTRGSIKPDGANTAFSAGARLHGVRLNATDARLTADRWLAFETSESGSPNSKVTSPWVVISMWIRPDADMGDSQVPCLFMVPQSLGLRYGRYDNGGDGFSVIQQGMYGSNAAKYYSAPAVSMAGRWVHVCAVYDRVGGSDHELWVDGEKMTSVGSSGGNINARWMHNYIELGGASRSDNDMMGRYNSCSATFRGAIDDVRVFNRKLSDAEIRTLASRPNVVNLGPSVDLPPAEPVKTTAKDVNNLALAAYPFGSDSLTTGWTVVQGEAENVVFGDPSQLSTTVIFKRKGDYGLGLSASDGERAAYSLPFGFDVGARGMAIIFR